MNVPTSCFEVHQHMRRAKNHIAQSVVLKRRILVKENNFVVENLYPVTKHIVGFFKPKCFKLMPFREQAETEGYTLQIFPYSSL